MVSKGTLGNRPESASCRACRLTQETHLMATLKLRSLPSPGMVTSSSTCTTKRAVEMLDGGFQRQSGIFYNPLVVWDTYFVSAYWQGHGSVEILSPIIHRLTISKDLGFKVLDHVLHDFTENKMIKTCYHIAPRYGFSTS